MLVRSSLSTAELCFTSSHAKSFLPSLLKRNMSSRKPSKSPLPPASAAKSSSDVGGFDPRNSERATRLRSAFTNRSSKQFTELIGDEWRYCFSRLPLHPLELSEKALQMLHSFMARNSIMFVMKPTADYGVDIARNLNLAKDNLPLSFGCTISVVQVYKGILLLRNAKSIVNYSLAQNATSAGKERAVLLYSLLTLLTMVISVFILNNTMA
ncbi:hypothetical protein OPV22_010852 [Ensete ventricosum]|uniref:Uncharacterized protein n=1 Tax=Ensete ventricosum TaxID=4639 RepID=A0AAV8Q3N6_ENSVE|nr:hypothetical protein OPV22_010852 [Ensete ventricosum]